MRVQRMLAMGMLVGTALLGATPATAEIDKSASAVLASALKPGMQSTLRKEVPGLVITKVTCYVPTTNAAISGPCTATFKLAKYKLLGTYRAKATLGNQMQVTWSTTSRSCTDLRRRRASCTGETSTGNGLISAQLAETQLLTNGLSYKAVAKKAKTAVCAGLKTSKWKRGEFDDVYARLKCSVKATDGASYSLVLVMSGNGYRLTKVQRA